MEHYELIKQIGKGTYGKVYTARNYQDHQLYVLKAIAADPEDADSAVRECHLLSLLRHPHIVPYKEFFHFDGELCLVMAHCEGGDVYSHVKAVRKQGKHVDEAKVWQWLVQLLLALSYCHTKKILHRDVKTQNIFMTKDGKLMLGDFGLAKQLQRTLEMARTPIGTPYYMAPEIYEETPYSFKSDVWALGCVFYEVMTGKPAFAADNLSRVVIRVLRGEYDPLPEQPYSASLRNLVSAMLTRDVHRRPTVNELLQHPCVVEKVQAYLDDLSSAGSSPSWQSTWRMKLPPSIMAQMAEIIQRASDSGCGAGPAPTPGAGAAAGMGVRGVRPGPSILERAEEALSAEDLIEQYGLEELLAEAQPKGGHSELDVFTSQLDVVRKEADNATLIKRQPGGGGAAGGKGDEELDGYESYDDDFQGDDVEDAAAQLLGGSVAGALRRRSGAGALPSGKAPDGTADEGDLLLMLTAGLPKAGFGFSPRSAALVAAADDSCGFTDAYTQPACGAGIGGAWARAAGAAGAPRAATTNGTDGVSPCKAKVAEGDGAAAVGGGALKVAGLARPATANGASPSKAKVAAAEGAAAAAAAAAAAPLAPTTPTPMANNWKLGTAAPSGSLRTALPGGGRFNATIDAAGVSGRGSPLGKQAPCGVARPGGSVFSLKGTLTNRAAFLRDLLRKELGPTTLEEAAVVVRKAYGAHGHDSALPADAMAELLAATGFAQLSKGQRGELAPLLDELVLLQLRNFAA
ncbi:hypothetical protein FOA52_006830 [Chlamydomonas sp. UWO 241]|nr:hypothetical protein FOA52_006830 [Chlamydomonas sp. UWO 241]